jgi:hypothetical protein
MCDLYDCCVCGEWKLPREMSILKTDLLNPKCVRYLNTTLNEKRICYRCKVRCPYCNEPVTRTHCDMQGGDRKCRGCAGRQAATLKKK